MRLVKFEQADDGSSVMVNPEQVEALSVYDKADTVIWLVSGAHANVKGTPALVATRLGADA